MEVAGPGRETFVPAGAPDVVLGVVGCRKRERVWSSIASMVLLPATGYTTDVEIPRAAERLFAIPPSRFVAERAALARTLAERKDPTAGAIRKLPRPVGLSWVLNRLARERSRQMEALFAAGDRLRSGQLRALSGAGADELRAAEEDVRAQARALRSEGKRIIASEGRAAPEVALARLELLLRVAAPVPGPAREALRRGVLIREPEIGSIELTGFAVLPGGRRAAAHPPSASRRAPRESRAARTVSRAAAAEQREARKREAEERRERERQAVVARRAAAARARAERAERAAEQAAERARRARERASAARAEADRLAATAPQLDRRPR